MTIHVKIDADGKINLPADLRERLGVTGGGSLLLEETPEGWVLSSLASAITQAQAIAHRHTGENPDASVDAFLRQRRADSGE